MCTYTFCEPLVLHFDSVSNTWRLWCTCSDR